MTFTFATPPSVAAETPYYLCWRSDASFYRYLNSGAADQEILHGPINYGDPWPDTLTVVDSNAYEDSIYAIYVEVNQAPTAPTSLQVDGQSSPTGENCISSLTPGFTAIYNDPDAGDISNAINIQVGTASGLSDKWDSGWLADNTVTPNRCTAKTYAGAALSVGTSYWWCCRFRDDGGLEGAWSEWQQFDVCAALNLVQMALI